jgi:hypothetical protein
MTTRDQAMFYQVIAQCTQTLKNLETWLDKAEQHAALKKYDVAVLMTSRLSPDQYHFIQQVQSACDYVKFAAARLSGQAPPKHEDTEQTIDDLRERIRKTIEFAQSVKETQYTGASDRKVGVTWAPPGEVIRGADYLLQLTIPNTYFHLTTAFAILRHNGVDVGKMDFLGPLNLVDA